MKPADADLWSPPADDIVEAVLPLDERAEDVQPEDEAAAQVAARRNRSRPRRHAARAVALGRSHRRSRGHRRLDRWQRRLQGLEHEYERRLREASSDDPEALAGPRARSAIASSCARSGRLPSPCCPKWPDWPPAAAVGRLAHGVGAPGATRHRQTRARVARAARVVAASAIGPVAFAKCATCSTPRLSTLTHEPPRRRARPRLRRHAARPRAADRSGSCSCRALPSACFRRRFARTALLPDRRARLIDAALATQTRRAADERLQLTLAVGAASERLYVSYPRIELNESRPRVPSFYVLDILRAIEGRHSAGVERCRPRVEAGGSTLAWPAPRDRRTGHRRLRTRPVDDGRRCCRVEVRQRSRAARAISTS